MRGLSRKNLRLRAFWGASNHAIYDSLRLMDAARAALARENAALKAALARARQGPGSRRGTGGRPRESVGRHGADRAAEASDRETGASGLRAAVGALGAADRSTGARPSKSWKPAPRKTSWRRRQAVARTTTVAGFTRKRPERNTFPEHLPRERVVIDPPTACACCGEQSPAQARRGRDAHAGNDAASVEGDRDGAGEVHLPGLREDQPSAGAVPCHRARMGGAEPAGDDRVREVRSASAFEPSGRALCPGRRADRAVDHGRRGGLGLHGARSAPSPRRSSCHGGRAPAWRRYDRAGSGRGQDRYRAVLDLCSRRQALRRRRAARGDVLLLARSPGRASAGASGGICRHPAGGRL